MAVTERFEEGIGPEKANILKVLNLKNRKTTTVCLSMAFGGTAMAYSILENFTAAAALGIGATVAVYAVGKLVTPKHT